MRLEEEEGAKPKCDCSSTSIIATGIRTDGVSPLVGSSIKECVTALDSSCARRIALYFVGCTECCAALEGVIEDALRCVGRYWTVAAQGLDRATRDCAGWQLHGITVPRLHWTAQGLAAAHYAGLMDALDCAAAGLHSDCATAWTTLDDT
ncbi:hypothetical protein Acr_18g0012200 [Actinidia rufa]|uniref:Uncharacterized protein n=1 Tax=Actinidia rufa TaxID=165716 RepID=A0A7J0G8C3_9ERIC|nr:hypothetical protein Acr_18g0012200 [Actinidia rufa]